MKLFYNSTWSEGQGKVFDSINPFDMSVVGEGRLPSEVQLEDCLGSAVRGAKTWKMRSLDYRINCLKHYKDLLVRDKEKLAKLISSEMGKVYWESLTEVSAAINKIEISIQAYKERCPNKQWDQAGVQASWQFMPLGVMLILGPFNFPLHLPNGHLVPALLAGNSVIFKPSEQASLVGEYNVQLLVEAGVGEALNLLYGGADVVNHLLDDSRVNGVLFTGSYHVGCQIHKRLAGRLEVMLALEMGGNNPLVIWDEKDINESVFITMMSAFLTTGQRCVCARRLILKEGVEGDRFLEALVKASAKISFGDPFDEKVFMGPLVNECAVDTMSKHVERLEGLGAKALLAKQYQSALVGPQILDMSQCSYDPDIEMFGPLLKVYRVANFGEAIELANKTQYGLSAGLISGDEDLFTTFQKHIRAGIVNWNRQITGAFSTSPFGGVGVSGNFRPGAYFASDYTAWPMASIKSSSTALPSELPPGISL